MFLFVNKLAPAWRTQSGDASTSGEIANFFMPPVQYWQDSIVEWADQWDMDPNLVATLIQIESCGDPKARSEAGAAGLFQVMPFHFQTEENPFEPETNARRALDYLNQGLKQAGGDVRLALAGYNGGLDLIEQPETNWPEQSSRYAYWGEGIYREAKAGEKQSQVLSEWLGAGGVKLCLQAGLRLGLQP